MKPKAQRRAAYRKEARELLRKLRSGEGRPPELDHYESKDLTENQL